LSDLTPFIPLSLGLRRGGRFFLRGWRPFVTPRGGGDKTTG